jgi:hypothetical protein
MKFGVKPDWLEDMMKEFGKPRVCNPCRVDVPPFSRVNYGKSWTLRSNFLVHLQEREAHMATATPPAACREIEIEWRYITDPYYRLVRPKIRQKVKRPDHIMSRP